MSEKYPGVIILDGADRAGFEMGPTILNFLSKISQIYGKPIKIQCGTNHKQYSASGLPSDHWLGNAADIYTYYDTQGNDTLTGDNIARAAYIASGIDPIKATEYSKKGALRNIFTNNRRIQIIWRTGVGGNHHDHIHVGVRARKEGDAKYGTVEEIFN